MSAIFFCVFLASYDHFEENSQQILACNSQNKTGRQTIRPELPFEEVSNTGKNAHNWARRFVLTEIQHLSISVDFLPCPGYLGGDRRARAVRVRIFDKYSVLVQWVSTSGVTSQPLASSTPVAPCMLLLRITHLACCSRAYLCRVAASNKYNGEKSRFSKLFHRKI